MLNFVLSFICEGDVAYTVHFQGKDLKEGFNLQEQIIQQLVETTEDREFPFKFKPLDTAFDHIEVSFGKRKEG